MSSALQTIETSSPSAPTTGLGAVTSKPVEIPGVALRTTRTRGKAAVAIFSVVALLLLNYLNHTKYLLELTSHNYYTTRDYR